MKYLTLSRARSLPLKCMRLCGYVYIYQYVDG